MKLTKILYGIILCLAVENGKYYSLATGDEEVPPPVGGNAETDLGNGASPLVQATGDTPVVSEGDGAGKTPASSTGVTPVSEAGPAVSASGGQTSGSEASSGTSTTTTTTTTSTHGPEGNTKDVASDLGDKSGQGEGKDGKPLGPAASLDTGTKTTDSIRTPISSASIQPSKPATDINLKGKEEKKIVKDGCNFYDKLDLGVKPFGEIKGDKTVCTVKLNEEFDAFLYACDGTSDPPMCPGEVKTEDGVVKIESLFAQATVTNESEKFPSKPNVFHVITGKANKPFSASCVCSKKDGTKETMELTSSFKQAGILGILGLMVVYLIN
nr:hypothetical protein MACL_00000161 [Theileria orientalis]